MIWLHKVLEIRYTMSNITPTSSTPKNVKQQSRALRGLDPDNPNDKAFELVTMFVSFFVLSQLTFFFFFLLSLS